MKVILLRDVAKIGRRYEVKEVPGGHALNFLIPHKLAEPATPDALRRLEVEKKKKSIVTERHDASFQTALEALLNVRVPLVLPANAQGTLFKTIRAADIVKALEAAGVHIEESEVVLTEPIKSIGEHTVKLHRGNMEGTATITITGA